MTSTRQIAQAIKVTPATRKFELRDEDGLRYDGNRAELVLAALSRSDRSDLPSEIHTIAYAIRKSLVTARMNPVAAGRIRALTPYQVCGIVAKVAAECDETTIGGICDEWLPKHQHELVAA